ncbi:MAG: oxygen-independent coproporphyrinogen III oxidase [marine bacterium B5-7]|nr:MAG: oxygen-independent coproporphyrinogen III oxidase [marine bacterium B5-7]
MLTIAVHLKGAKALPDLRIVNMGFNLELIKKYDHAGPRYTSYPTANLFSDKFDRSTYVHNARASNEHLVPGQISLYFHIPFCDTLCFYCACNKIVTKNRSRAVEYLDYLKKEIRLQGELFDSDREVVQLHFGGGTPTFLSNEQIADLLEYTSYHFYLKQDSRREFSIEIDPRGVDVARLAGLRELGFNRISLGVQDFDPKVQRAVHRIQSPEETLNLIKAARQMGFVSTNVDLIYGLPLQSESTFRETVERVLESEPERLSIFNYAHLPQMFFPQQRIREADLPRPEEKLAILNSTVSILGKAGYKYIGMDHFAKPDDGLALAQKNGTLNRNFQGYSTYADCDLIALGVSAISKVDLCYSQNHKKLEDYYADLDHDRLPIARGTEMSQDDLTRRAVIEKLICYYTVDLNTVCRSAGVDAKEYFGYEWEVLENLQYDGLVKLDHRNHRVDVTPSGRFLLRTICMTFDHYLRRPGAQGTYSKVI